MSDPFPLPFPETRQEALSVVVSVLMERGPSRIPRDRCLYRGKRGKTVTACAAGMFLTRDEAVVMDEAEGNLRILLESSEAGDGAGAGLESILDRFAADRRFWFAMQDAHDNAAADTVSYFGRLNWAKFRAQLAIECNKVATEFRLDLPLALIPFLPPAPTRTA